MTWLTNSSILGAGILLALYQVLAALPWLRAIDPKGFDRGLKNPVSFSYGVLTVVGKLQQREAGQAVPGPSPIAFPQRTPDKTTPAAWSV